MALSGKAGDMPPSANPTAWQNTPERDFLAFKLISLAKFLLDGHFADPAEIKAYRRSRRRGAVKQTAGSPALATWEGQGAKFVLTALPRAGFFRLNLHSERFDAALTLRYAPEAAMLQDATVEQFSGDIQAALGEAGKWSDEVPDKEDDLPNDAVDLLAGLAVAETLSPTAAARRAEALVRAAAGELRRKGTPAISAADKIWMENQPESLWPLLDAAVAASIAPERDETLIGASRWLLANQLELIRYRLERGHDWARAMLDDYQERLIALARAHTLPEADWFVLVTLLRDAKVPIRPEMTEALAQAAADATPGEAPPAQEIPRELRRILDELARSTEDPFMVVEGLAETGTLMPPDLRAYLTHELGLSPHPVLRETVPLLLLDPEPAVRQAAAAALEQVAGPETFSPVMLRRTLLVRNWMPEAEREAIDRLVRKVRLKEVACAQWPAAPPLAIQSSMVDGSGAQSLILTTPGSRAGPFIGLLLKQGFGVRDAWCNRSVPRREITHTLKEAQQQTAWLAVGRDYLDVVVQHHIARGLAMGNLPQMTIMEIAEAIGAADWKDRGLDLAAETERLYSGLDAGSAVIAASLQRSGKWLAEDPAMESWFEDDPAIRALVTGKPRPKPDGAVRRVIEEVLPARREAWAERLLLMALWLRAGTGDDKPAERWQDCVVLGHELLAGRPLVELPAMVAIAERSVFAARLGIR